MFVHHPARYLLHSLGVFIIHSVIVDSKMIWALCFEVFVLLAFVIVDNARGQKEVLDERETFLAGCAVPSGRQSR